MPVFIARIMTINSLASLSIGTSEDTWLAKFESRIYILVVISFVLGVKP